MPHERFNHDYRHSEDVGCEWKARYYVLGKLVGRIMQRVRVSADDVPY